MIEEGVTTRIPNVLDDLLNLLLLGALNDVVSPGILISSDEIRVVDSWEGDHVLHVGPQLLLEINVKNLSPGHCICQVHVANVPPTKHYVIWVHLYQIQFSLHHSNIFTHDPDRHQQ